MVRGVTVCTIVLRGHCGRVRDGVKRSRATFQCLVNNVKTTLHRALLQGLQLLGTGLGAFHGDC